MKYEIAFAVVAALLLSHAAPARADLIELPALSQGNTEYSLFVIKDPRKTTPQRAIADLTKLLAPLNRTPCLVATDRGAAVTCSDGLVTVSATHAYTYNINQAFPNVISELRALDPNKFKGVKLPDGVGQTWSVNFLPPPTNGAPCVGLCNIVGPVQIDFSAAVSEFGVAVDNGDVMPLADQVRVTINGHVFVKNLIFGVTSLRFQDIDMNTGAIIPITSVTLEPLGGASQAFLLDRFAYVR